MNFPTLQNKYKNEIDLIDKILKIYSIAQDKPLTNFERQTLIYYIRYDFSKETREYIKEDSGKTSNYLGVIDRKLKEKGYLYDLENNYRKKKLSPDMMAIRKAFVEKKRKVYVLTFNPDATEK